MIKGLKFFRDFFNDYQEQYILIGGSASYLTLQEEGIQFRVTKDLDIIIVIEVLSKDFVSKFWEFIKIGGYQYVKPSGNINFYRFQKPTNDIFPFMIEILSREPNVLGKIPEGNIFRMSIEEEIVSLSAILLNSTYYNFILENTRNFDGINIVSDLCLIALKVRAYLDLSNRKKNGETIKSGDIKKHKNDIFRLSQLLSGNSKISAPKLIVDDIINFINEMRETEISLRDLNIVGTKKYYLDQIEKIFGH
ncbi:MAG: hypothetical protein KQ78_00339 [Candidatus Izimaplasma bacterium HR2]|nr:MAG: hypothetical protein KQ78_00339 [Candidatus Izimaplasma bacterium HR2]